MPLPTKLTFTFGWTLSADEKAAVTELVDSWAGIQTETREGFPNQHVRHVDDVEPLDCRDCTAGIVSAPGTSRVLVCARLHRVPLTVKPCHAQCVVECGRGR